VTKPYVRKGGWGGRRPGAGRKPGPKPAIPAGTAAPLPNGRRDAVLQALRQLADGDVELRHRLDRLERAGAKQGERLAKAQQALDRILQHQAAIARTVGAIEPTAPLRHTRRRPLGV
jgi:hypothetical protein